ncbi:hypothetical protein ACFL35_03595 [Candidatus Riflebacteria bacterium]
MLKFDARTEATREHFQFKMVFNEDGAIVFPVTMEHRDQKFKRISYKDNYQGNALAAMLMPGKIEIRFHADFDDERVKNIIIKIKDQPELEFLKNWRVVYQGRILG